MKARHRIEATAIRTLMAPATRWSLTPGTTWTQRRTRSAGLARFGRVPRGIVIEHGHLAGLPCEIATPPDARGDLVMLYLHGGGWTVGSARTHRALVARLATRMRVRAWSVDYRLAPEDPFPAALDDCVAGYRALLDAGHSRIAVAGDSAGGGLTTSLGITLRDQGLPAPAALGMLCPAVDLTETALARLVDSQREPILSTRILREMFRAYGDQHDRSDPLLSPLLAELAGLPPTVLDSASDDLLAEQGLALAEAIRSAGGHLDHRHHPGVWHVFHALAGTWPVATRALDDFADRLVAAAQQR